VANDKLSGKVEDQEAQIVGFRGQCIYLNQHLMKFKSWPTKEEAPPVVKGKGSTLEKAGADHKEREMCQHAVEEGPIEKGHEVPPSPEVKRRKTGNSKAYLARFK
jgi:hypothetical protein